MSVPYVSSTAMSVELSGLDGANPLGFLAALGTLVTLHRAGERRAQLRWRRAGTWVPVVEGLSVADRAQTDAVRETLAGAVAGVLRGAAASAGDQARREAAQRAVAAAGKAFESAKRALKARRDEIRRRGLPARERKAAIEQEVRPLELDCEEKRKQWLAALREAVPRPELALGKRLDCSPDEFRSHAAALLEDAGSAGRDALDFLAAFGSDACRDGRSGRIEPTPFEFIKGSGWQFFLDTARQLMEQVSPERVRQTLFEPWAYRDESLSMRWDPVEDRRYALMDRDPTARGNKPRTVWMANLLAYHALVLFPSVPTRSGLATTGWSDVDGTPALTWPIWSRPVGPETIRSLLLLPELGAATPDRAVLQTRGIVAVFRAARIQVGEGANSKLNFSPPQCLAASRD